MLGHPNYHIKEYSSTHTTQQRLHSSSAIIPTFCITCSPRSSPSIHSKATDRSIKVCRSSQMQTHVPITPMLQRNTLKHKINMHKSSETGRRKLSGHSHLRGAAYFRRVSSEESKVVGEKLRASCPKHRDRRQRHQYQSCAWQPW